MSLIRPLSVQPFRITMIMSMSCLKIINGGPEPDKTSDFSPFEYGAKEMDLELENQ